MMIRGRIPGGVMTANQWRVFDELAWKYGNNTLRITTRQSIQFHGVVKAGLRLVIKKINESLLSTLAACGDVNRNVLAPPTPAYTKAREQVYRRLRAGGRCARAADPAYHAIWIDGVQLKMTTRKTSVRGPALRQNLFAAQIQGRLCHSAGE
jgi:sulfite reductase (NADPH) hemoprotein beta-component